MSCPSLRLLPTPIGKAPEAFDGGDAGCGVFDADAAADVRARPRRRRGRCRGGFEMRDGGRVGDGVEEVGQPHAFQQERAVLLADARGDFPLAFASMLSSSGKMPGYVGGLTAWIHLDVVVFCGGSVLANSASLIRFCRRAARMRLRESSRDTPLSCSLNLRSILMPSSSA